MDKIVPGSLNVDFDEVTKLFSELKSRLRRVTEAREMAPMLQEAVQRIFLKYYVFPESRFYKQEDLRYLIKHVTDCINNIIPVDIPYKAVFVDGTWKLFPKKEEDDLKPS